MLSITEEAARLWVAAVPAGCSEQERGWVPRLDHESWLGLMQEMELLRVPLLFGRAHAAFTLSEGGAVATVNVQDYSRRTAASKVVMRSGYHFVDFTLLAGTNLFFGVIRPGCDVEGGAATASTTRPSGSASPVATAGRGCRALTSRATASACCLTSIRAA